MTKGGVACVFPFVYEGVTYEACTDADNLGIPWCVTTLADDNTVVDNGLYGDCDMATCHGTQIYTSCSLVYPLRFMYKICRFLSVKFQLPITFFLFGRFI